MRITAVWVLLGLRLSGSLATPTPGRLADAGTVQHADEWGSNEHHHAQMPLLFDHPPVHNHPDRPHWPPWEVPRDEPEMTELLDKWAPVIKLSSLEQYYPSSIEYMLAHYTSLETDDRTPLYLNQSDLTPERLDRLPARGLGTILDIAEPHNPQPFLLDEESMYLFGPTGQPGGMAVGPDGRGRVSEPVYGFWVDQGRGVVDLWYWTFYPFNYGKPVGPFGFLGHHVSDWERVRVRTLNGSAISVDYTTHSGGTFSAGTVRWEDVLKVDGRPVAYSAMGSHGVWPEPGDHIYAHLLKFQLVDLTDDDGALWDTKGHVVPAAFWTGDAMQHKLKHYEDESWLNFRGKWGNKGDDSCWWHRAVGICQLVDGPPGPNRNLAAIPDCVPAPLWYSRSSFSFYLSQHIVNWSIWKEITNVQVEQICARPRKPGEDDGFGMSAWTAKGKVDYVHDQTQDEDIEVWSISGQTDFKKRLLHTVETVPCRGRNAAVKGYRIKLCTKDECHATSPDRKICTYETGKPGYKFGNAVRLEDLDEWRFLPPVPGH